MNKKTMATTANGIKMRNAVVVTLSLATGVATVSAADWAGHWNEAGSVRDLQEPPASGVSKNPYVEEVALVVIPLEGEAQISK